MSSLYDHTHGGSPASSGAMLDFSINISPVLPPIGPVVVEPSELMRYPSIDGAGIRSFYVDRFKLDPNSVLPLNGAAEGIYLLPRAHGLRRVLIPAPSFYEYERACRIAGAEVVWMELSEADGFAMPSFERLVSAMDGVDALFLANPNNPTGTELPPGMLPGLASRFPEKWFIVDEAFIQYTAAFPRNSLMREVMAMKNVVVVHSLTKFYALPGLRLGAVVAHPDVIERLLFHKEPWTVNAVAEQVAGRLAGCGTWEESLRKMLAAERERIQRECSSIEGLTLYGGSANFFLARSTRSLDVLLPQFTRKGIHLRDARNFRGLEGEWFRFAVRTPDENTRLIALFREVMP
ncbi:threonine-phosphate decarboxylase CobD [Pelodictyon luteolum]|uniref:threonine-phosphate decarboxylase n=1 Tax=Chlorobium luteolum (strain DSM 273 / BCRC 81028 / 2530) TaxID=319225 RepID=Q3B3T0_CHLL3|nr:threonine-phosphate decarboxylase CobD [Pelodictyon luteolum]ABB24001.1 L-threonine O-3-phosphate decarboxylase [Pelodictyon luteolum DSM 273]